MEEAPHYDLGGEMEPRKEAAPVAFNKPTKGTSVEKFREMIISHLKVRKALFKSRFKAWVCSKAYSFHHRQKSGIKPISQTWQPRYCPLQIPIKTAISRCQRLAPPGPCCSSTSSCWRSSCRNEITHPSCSASVEICT